jgi:hypothetical protein
VLGFVVLQRIQRVDLAWWARESSGSLHKLDELFFWRAVVLKLRVVQGILIWPRLPCRRGGGPEEATDLALLRRLGDSSEDLGAVLRCAPEAVRCGAPKRRHGCQRYLWPARPLHARALPSSFFLQAKLPVRRIFDLEAGITAGVTPSGSVPGGGVGAGDSRAVCFGGEDEGPDRFFQVLVKVLVAKFEGWLVISISLEVLHVIWYQSLQ